MISVYIPNTSKQSIGGGWTFRRNFIKGAKDKFNIVYNWRDCDIVLIAGVTMTDRTEMQEAQKTGKKIVLRIDNMPKDSRNRGTAISRMRDFALMADAIIFQSQWAREYVGSWLINKVQATAMRGVPTIEEQVGIESFSPQNYVIHNGVDIDFFHNTNSNNNRLKNYLVVQHNSDENKRVYEAFYNFFKRYKDDNEVRLHIVGRFSPDLVQYNFDFFNDEKIIYHGIINSPEDMGNIMRLCKFIYFPAFADASPNTLAEAIACGCTPLLLNDVGGSKEVAENVSSIQDMADKYLEVFKKLL